MYLPIHIEGIDEHTGNVFILADEETKIEINRHVTLWVKIKQMQ